MPRLEIEYCNRILTPASGTFSLECFAEGANPDLLTNCYRDFLFYIGGNGRHRRLLRGGFGPSLL